MATELYGVFAQLAPSEASTPVSTDTNVIFIGACASGDLNKAHIITSMSDYATKLGGEAGDGYNLSEAAIAAFSIAGLNKVIMIPVSHSTTFTAADYIGNAASLSGVYAIEHYLRENPTAVNIIVAPSIDDSTVLEAIKTVATLADGHWKSFMIYDLPCEDDHINAAGIAQVDVIVGDKQISSEIADAVWGRVKTAGGFVISGAAVRACLMARSDAAKGVPDRCGGNLAVDGMSKVVIVTSEEKDVILKEADATSLSADGVCSWINYGGGRWHTWGDHTSAFSNGTISEERGRFDNIIRMNQMIANRFQLKYRFEIDNPMTLGMRNAVINEELDYLNGLVAIDALIGEPVVEFRAADNPIDGVAAGRFVWYTADTPTIPAKYMLNKIAYTQAGLSVYYTEE
jgi:hypothetical protein